MIYIGPTHLKLIRLIITGLLQKRKSILRKLKLHPGSTVSKINKDTPTSSVWNKICKLQGKYIPQPLPSLVVNSSAISHPKDASDVLAEHFSKISSKESLGQDFRNAVYEKEYPKFNTNNLEYYNVSFTM